MYKLWTDNWNTVDRLNEDYHNHFQLHGSHSANTWALESVAFYLMMAARAIWEENCSLHAYHRADKNFDVVPEKPRLSFPHFLFNAATLLKARVSSRHKDVVPDD